MSRNTVLSCFVVFPIAFVFAQSRVLQKHHWLVGRTADRCSESPPSPQCASATRTPQEDPLFVGQQWIPWTTDTRRSAATGGRRLRKDCWTFEPNVFRFFFLVSKSLQHEIPLLGALSLSSSASARKRRWKSSPAPGQVKQMPKLRPWSPRRFLFCSWTDECLRWGEGIYGTLFTVGGRGFTGRCGFAKHVVGSGSFVCCWFCFVRKHEDLGQKRFLSIVCERCEEHSLKTMKTIKHFCNVRCRSWKELRV